MQRPRAERSRFREYGLRVQGLAKKGQVFRVWGLGFGCSEFLGVKCVGFWVFGVPRDGEFQKRDLDFGVVAFYEPGQKPTTSKLLLLHVAASTPSKRTRLVHGLDSIFLVGFKVPAKL